MPEAQEIITDTGPLIALVAALGDLRVLQIYRQAWVPLEVSQEIAAGGAAQFALAEFEAAHWLKKCVKPARIATDLLSTLDGGEAAVMSATAAARSLLRWRCSTSRNRTVARLTS